MTQVSDWRRHYNALSTPMDSGGVGRRRFLQGLLAAGTLTVTGMPWGSGIGGIGGIETARALGADDRILVLIMMGGGNDGFSMVVPADNGQYQDNRGNLAIAPSAAIPFDGGLYWHPNLPAMSRRYNDGDVAVVQGIGDPADDRSHFSSMARWMRGVADPAPPLGFTGWLGRWLDGAGLNGFGGVSVGDGGVPLHMRGVDSQVTAMSRYGNLYGAEVDPWEVPAINAFREMRDEGPGGVWANAAAAAMANAIDTASTVAPVYDRALPDEGLPRDMAIAAELINLDVGARVLTTAFGDFDTHDDHLPRHNPLMADLDLAVDEFFNRLSPEFADRVVVMTFSEFGRSWTSNDAAGIDHGTSSVALVMGRAVRGGLFGEMPNFNRRDVLGDLESTVDFRSYYATILDGWLNADSGEILGGSYEDLGFFQSELASCDGLTPTIVGTDGPDVIEGTSGADIISAGAGDDFIKGLGGDDLICAGEGADVVWGGAGGDFIIAGGGDDEVRGDDGDDVIRGGLGDDKLRGSQGADKINGNGGNDVIHGNRGNDVLSGDEGDDRIYGYAHDDEIWGGPGKDRLHGNYGNDMIHGGDGNDRIFGYGNDDRLIGGNGVDVVGGNFGNDTIEGGAGNDRLYGSDGADTVIGGQGHDTVEGNSGADEIFGNDGDDVLDGGINVDTCTGGPGTDSASRCETTFGIE